MAALQVALESALENLKSGKGWGTLALDNIGRDLADAYVELGGAPVTRAARCRYAAVYAVPYYGRGLRWWVMVRLWPVVLRVLS